MFLRVSHIINLLLIVFSFKVSKSLEWRIFEGQDLRYDVHSYLVQLKFYRYNISSVGLCTGSIVSSTWIISSAHCVRPRLHTVIVLQGTRPNIRKIAELNKSDVHCHPDFIPEVDTMTNREKDIALLYMTVPINCNRYIKPIRISTLHPRVGDSGVIAGYGETEVNLSTPREGIVVIDTCPDYGTSNICTTGSVRAGAGDSGGPLIYKGKLAGLISGGCLHVHTNRKCLTVFASIHGNIEWILGVINSME